MNLGVEELNAIAAEWRTARRIQPIYSGIAQRFALEAPPCQELGSPVDRADPDAIASVRRWLQQMDELIQVHQLRLFLQTGSLSTEINLRTLAMRHLTKKERTAADRDKLDFLLVQYFAECAPSTMLHSDPSALEVAHVLEPVLGQSDAELPGWLEPLEDARRRLNRCATMRELLRQGVLNEVRKIKVAADDNYFIAPALIAFTRFNYLVRQAFFKLMRADTEVIRYGVRELLKRGVTVVNGERAQLSAHEPLTHINELCQRWKKPFQAEYSAGNPFAQLAEVRATIDEAMAQYGVPSMGSEQPAAAQRGKTAGAPSLAPVVSPAPSRAAAAPPQPPSQPGAPTVQPPQFAASAAVQSTSAPAQPASLGFTVAPAALAALQQSQAPQPGPDVAPSAAQLGLTEDLRMVQAQLSNYLMADPARSRTNGASIVLGNGRLPLSSWEVTAFVEGIGDFSQAIQTGVAVRVLLFQAMEQAKQGGPRQKLSAVLALANGEVLRLQNAVKESRDERNIEATVTLSATLQRLTALLDEAAKL